LSTEGKREFVEAEFFVRVPKGKKRGQVKERKKARERGWGVGEGGSTKIRCLSLDCEAWVKEANSMIRRGNKGGGETIGRIKKGKGLTKFFQKRWITVRGGKNILSVKERKKTCS